MNHASKTHLPESFREETKRQTNRCDFGLVLGYWGLVGFEVHMPRSFIFISFITKLI